ncbi:MAG: YkgJ family cysteine cluster protein [Candidatus Omnitrophica bacterium]|nr:YkgJ family cysteine cluster protein [Candidatus Omnitrophota bacterium]
MNSEIENRIQEFACRRCNACCRQSGYVYLREGEAERLAGFLGQDVYEFTQDFCEVADRRSLVLKKHSDEACVFLTPQGCSVHPVKPAQCAEFPYRWRTPRSFDYCEGLKSLAEKVLRGQK